MRKSQQKLNHVQFKQSGPLVVIVGPTASGKTKLAIDLAGQFDGEIVCADSLTIYQELNIGTAKPSGDDQTKVTHHLLDIIRPDESYSVANFVKQAQSVLIDIWTRGSKLPIIVGGSGLYIDALLHNYSFRSQGLVLDGASLGLLSDEQLIEIGAKKHGLRPLQSIAQNRRRLEQFAMYGPPPVIDRHKLAFDCLGLYLDPGDTELRSNVVLRTEEMLENGLIDEVKQLRHRYGDSCQSLSSVGYAQVSSYLDQDLLIDDLAPAINRATWKLIRKQRTWFRRDKYLNKIESLDAAKKLTKKYLITYKAQHKTQKVQ